jgi:RNase P subunit RPR2
MNSNYIRFFFICLFISGFSFTVGFFVPIMTNNTIAFLFIISVLIIRQIGKNLIKKYYDTKRKNLKNWYLLKKGTCPNCKKTKQDFLIENCDSKVILTCNSCESQFFYYKDSEEDEAFAILKKPLTV